MIQSIGESEHRINAKALHQRTPPSSGLSPCRRYWAKARRFSPATSAVAGQFRVM